MHVSENLIINIQHKRNINYRKILVCF